MELKEKINQANQRAVDCIINSDPVWVDIQPAIDSIDGIEDHMIIHSGPPVEYKDMCMLHRRGMVSAALFEGWAKDEDEAKKMLDNGDFKIVSALDYNTVGAGTGIITKSIQMMIVEDKTSGKKSAIFPAEGSFEGGFCGWGLYSKDIAENLIYMKDVLFPPIIEMLKKRGGVPLKPILAESLQMGDENHTRQTAADLLLLDKIIMDMLDLDIDMENIKKSIGYIVDTPRFFHCLGQGACRSAMLSAVGIEYSTMITAVCGNAIEFGIKIAGLGNEWFTAPSPMMEGKYTSSKFKIEDQLPWIGDSCVVECAGMGGMAAAASPIVLALRGQKLKDAIAQTREMEQICIAKNKNFPVANLDFNFLPVGIDIRKVLASGILPVIHGGMFNKEGGLMGAGSARVPMLCFEKALKAFSEKYKG